MFASIGIEREYSELDLSGLELDLQGWGSNRPIFDVLMEEVRPTVVIEVGVWKGASLLRMHRLARKLDLETQFIAVDTWLGSAELWLEPEHRSGLRLRGGYPDLFRQFAFNLIARDAGDVFALPLTSSAAAVVLRKLGIRAELIYIDAGHEENDVREDLRNYYNALAPGGVIFGDDYDPVTFPGLVHAVDTFARRRRLEVEHVGRVWVIRTKR